ncbi:unnamed protein product, partial [Prorocentrum cordatum]
ALAGARPAAAAGAAATRARLEEAASSLDSLLGRYEDVKQKRQGDVVRTAVNGRASPALAVQLQGSAMARDAEDPVAFADALEDYLSCRTQVDAYVVFLPPTPPRSRSPGTGRSTPRRTTWSRRGSRS